MLAVVRRHHGPPEQCHERTPGGDGRTFRGGAFRFVAPGEYEEGYRAGQAMVVKWIKTGPVFEDEFYASELEVSRKS